MRIEEVPVVFEEVPAFSLSSSKGLSRRSRWDRSWGLWRRLFPPHHYYSDALIIKFHLHCNIHNSHKYNFPAADHRHFSLHVHHPLSKPPADSRRKRTNEGRKEGRRGSAPNAAATIEEDQEEEEGEEESYSQNDGEEGRMTTATRQVTHLKGLVTQSCRDL